MKICSALSLVVLLNTLASTWSRPNFAPKIIEISSVDAKLKKTRTPLNYFPLPIPFEGFQPEVLSTLSNRTLSLGHGTSFRCHVIGNPKPRIKWKKNGVTIVQNRRIKVRNFRWGSRLRIKNIQKTDKGVYRCIAKNLHGSTVSAPAYVKIRDNKRGRCQVYTGTICNTNLFYLKYNQNQHKIERTIAKTIQSVQGIASPRCIKQLTKFLCRQNYPSCTLNYNNKPRKVCREDCHELEKRACRRDINAIGQAWRQIVTCSNLPSFTGKPGDDCQQVFANYRTSTKQNKTSTISPMSIYKHQHSSSQCTKYSGDFCKSYIVPGQQVTIHGNKTEKQAEIGLTRLFHRLHGYISSNCGLYLRKALCYHTFSPCFSGQIPETNHICRLQCEILQGRVCSKEFQLAKLVNEGMVSLPKCYTLPPNKNDDNKQCLDLGINVNDPANSGLDKCSEFFRRTQRNDSFTVLQPLNTDHEPCPKGPARTHLLSNLPKSITHLLKDVSKSIHYGKVTEAKQETRVHYCIPLNATLKSLTWNWKHYHKTSLLPNIIFQAENIKVSNIKVTIDRFSSIETIVVPLGSAVSYKAHAKFHLDNVTFFYRHQSLEGAFMARGKYRLCTTTFDVVMVTYKNGGVKISGNSTNPLDVSTIERVFGLASLSANVYDVIRRSELLLMRLVSPSLEVFIDGDDVTVKFSGRSYLAVEGQETFLEFYGGKGTGSELLVTSLSTSHMTLNNALRTFTGIDFPLFDWMTHSSNNSKVGVLLSTQTIQSNSRFQLVGEPLSSTLRGLIPEGLTLVAHSSIPNVCDDNRFCELMRIIFGQDSLSKIKITSNTDKVTVDAEIDKESDHALIRYKRIKLSMNVLKGNLTIDMLPLLSFKASGYIQMSNTSEENLYVDGQLQYDGVMSTLNGVFQVNQDWVNAFGVNYLTLSNMRASFSLPTDSSNANTVHSVDARCDFYFGVGCSQSHNAVQKDNCIAGQMFMGLSEDISQHYFYGTTGPVSLQQLLQAYDIKASLPDVVKTIGFPAGLKISVAKSLHDKRMDGGPLIKPGLLMSGRLRVLGIDTDATLSLTPRDFLIDADITGDIIDKVKDFDKLKADKYSRTKLYMKTRINPTAYIKINIKGYSRIFGIFDSVDILVSGEMTQITMVAEIHKSVYAHVFLTSNYSKDTNKTHLEAKIIFKNELSKLTRLASKHVVSLLEDEMTQIKTAEKEVKQRSRDCIKSSKQDCAKCLNRRDCLSALLHCYQSTKTQRKSSLNALCQQLSLGNQLGVNNSCQRFTTLMGSNPNNTCRQYHKASKQLQKLQQSLKWVRQARALVSGNLFNLHSISFEAQVVPSDLQNTVVDTTFDVTIFGQRNQLKGLKLHLESFSKLAAEIAKKAFLWYNKRYRLYGN